LEYLSVRVEDPVNRRGRLNLGSAFLSRWLLAGDLEPKSYFEMASNNLRVCPKNKYPAGV
jgi:hypothetical protein